MSDRTAGGLAGTAIGVGALVGGIAIATVMSGRDRKTFRDTPRYVRDDKRDGLTVTGRTVTIAKPRREIYDFWRDFSNLPQIMENLEEVRPADGGTSIWVVKSPGGAVELQTEVTQDQPGELIAWRSVEGSDIETTGEVRFEDAPGERGTRVTLMIEYKPPVGELGRLAAKLLRREPEIQAWHALKRLKMHLETGEIATSARQRENADTNERETN